MGLIIIIIIYQVAITALQFRSLKLAWGAHNAGTVYHCITVTLAICKFVYVKHGTHAR